MFYIGLVLFSMFCCVRGTICGVGESPLEKSCVFCSSTGEGCNNRGSCNSRTRNSSFSMCSCSGFLPPQCVEALPNRLCDASNPLDVPINNSCTYCVVGSNSTGCANRGICYYGTVGSAQLLIPICACPFAWTGPTCSVPRQALRICDPTDPSDFPPGCDLCRLNASLGSNGCANSGFCVLQANTTPSAPPNAQFPNCTCQTGFVARQCIQSYFVYYGRTDLIPLRWFYFSIFLVLTILALLVVAQHLYYGAAYKFLWSNIPKIAAAFLVAVAGILQAIRNGINPQGSIYGYPDYYSVVSMLLLNNFAIGLISICIAIFTCNWIAIAQSAVSTLRRKTGWGTVPLTIFLIYTTVQIGLVLFFSLYQVGGISRLFDPITAIIVAILLLFSVTSGVVVLCTIRKIAASSPSADPKLLFRTASQLILLSFIELLAVFAFGIVGAIGSTVQNNFPVIYGITVVFDQLNQWVIMAALIAQAKMSTWQLKELATARPVTRAESTDHQSTALETTGASARKTEQDYSNSDHGVMSI